MCFCMRTSWCSEESVPGFDDFWVTFRDMPDSPCRCLTSVGHAAMPDLRWNKAAYLLDLIGIPCQICQTVAEDSMIFYDHLCVICVLKKRLTEKLRLCASWKGSPLWSMQWAIPLPSSKKLKHWASGTWTSKLPASWSKYVQTCPNITKHIKDIKALTCSYWNHGLEALASLLRSPRLSLPFFNHKLPRYQGWLFQRSFDGYHWWPTRWASFDASEGGLALLAELCRQHQ